MTTSLNGGHVEKGFTTMFAHLLAEWQRNRNRRAAIRQLHRLPAFLLADVGIPPESVNEVVDALLAGGTGAGAQQGNRAAPDRRSGGAAVRAPLTLTGRAP